MSALLEADVEMRSKDETFYGTAVSTVCESRTSFRCCALFQLTALSLAATLHLRGMQLPTQDAWPTASGGPSAQKVVISCTEGKWVP